MNHIHSLVGHRSLRAAQGAPGSIRGGGCGTAHAGGSRLRRHALPSACAMALAAGMLALPAWAGTYTVTQSADDGTGTTPGSLSWAIGQAGLNPGSTIVIAAGTGTITESGTLPPLGQDTTIQGSLAIVGPGAAPLSIEPAGSGGITLQLGDGTSAGVASVAGAGGNGGANATAPGVAGGAGGGGVGAVDVAAHAALVDSSGTSLAGGNGGNGGNASGRFARAGVAAGAGGNGGIGGTAVAATGSVLTNNGGIAGGIGGNGGYGGDGIPPGHGGNGGNGGAGVGGTGFVVTNSGGIDGGKAGYGGTGGFGGAYGGTGGHGGTGGAGVTGSGFTVDNSGGIYGGYGRAGGVGGIGGTEGPGGNGGAGGAGVSGSDFTLANSGLVAGRAGGDGGSGGTGGNAGTGGAGVTGNGFSATNTGTILGAAGGRYGGGASAPGTGGAGTGGAGVGGRGFTLTNDSTIVAGVGGFGRTGGYGGAGVAGTGFTLTNNGVITGGAGGPGNATGGNGGAGISGARFTLIHAAGAIITGGNGGSSGVAPGDGGAGIVSTGGANITTNGSIAGGTGAGGQADAIDFSGGGNVLTLEDTVPTTPVPPLYAFTGNVVSTSGVGASAVHGGDTLALGGSVAGAFDLFDFAQVVAAPTGWTGTVQYAGFNRFEKTGSSTWQVLDGATFAGGGAVRAGTLQMDFGSFSGGALVVDAGATLDGQGFLLFAPTTIEAGGTLRLGLPSGPSDVGSEAPLSMLGKLAVTINGTSAFGNVTVAGAAATFGTSSFFDFALGNDTTQRVGDTFQFFDADSFINFADIGSHYRCSGLMAGLACALGMNGAGNGLVLTLDARSHGVPEPGSLGLFGLGLLLLGGGMARRARRGAKAT